MTRTVDILKHVARTFALVAIVAAVLIAAFAAIVLLLPEWAAMWVGLPALFGSLLAMIATFSRWTAYSTPVARRVDRLRWTDEQGTEFASEVEIAQVRAATYAGAAAIGQDVLRVSVYSRDGRKRIHRTLIGDDERYLGRHGDGFWFFIESRFYARKNGLVCIDPRTCETLFHLPRKRGELIEPDRHRAPVIELNDGDRTVRIDLRRPIEEVRRSCDAVARSGGEAHSTGRW